MFVESDLNIFSFSTSLNNLNHYRCFKQFNFKLYPFFLSQMSTNSACPRSPRTEKRLSEKLRRREMRMNGDIADKLNRPDLMTLDLSFHSRPDVSLRVFSLICLQTHSFLYLSVPHYTCWIQRCTLSSNFISFHKMIPTL